MNNMDFPNNLTHLYLSPFHLSDWAELLPYKKFDVALMVTYCGEQVHYKNGSESSALFDSLKGKVRLKEILELLSEHDLRPFEYILIADDVSIQSIKTNDDDTLLKFFQPNFQRAYLSEIVDRWAGDSHNANCVATEQGTIYRTEAGILVPEVEAINVPRLINYLVDEENLENAKSSVRTHRKRLFYTHVENILETKVL